MKRLFRRRSSQALFSWHAPDCSFLYVVSMPQLEPHGNPVDPYRIFFPLGILMGIASVSIWPLYYWGAIGGYNGRSHASFKPTASSTRSSSDFSGLPCLDSRARVSLPAPVNISLHAC